MYPPTPKKSRCFVHTKNKTLSKQHSIEDKHEQHLHNNKNNMHLTLFYLIFIFFIQERVENKHSFPIIPSSQWLFFIYKNIPQCNAFLIHKLIEHMQITEKQSLLIWNRNYKYIFKSYKILNIFITCSILYLYITH